MPTIITRGAASAKAYGFTNGGASIPSSSQTYASPGTYTWVAPAGVTSVSAVAVGGGGTYYCMATAGRGGSLSYLNNYTVTPCSSYTVVVGTAAAASYFINSSTLNAISGCQSSLNNKGTASFTGGTTDSGSRGGGGGAGGYSGNGGAGNAGAFNGSSGSGGGGGGGGGGAGGANSHSGGGGGVGLFGQGASGAGGIYCAGNNSGTGGVGGSGGSSGQTGVFGCGGNGGNFGGGAGYLGAAGTGGVRIVWPGNTRQFPSTCVSTTGEYGSSIFAGTPGTYTWVAPAGVTKISAVAVGAGGRGFIQAAGGGSCNYTPGAGGSLSYLNNYTVTPGNSYTVYVGISGGNLSINGNSYFNNSSTLYAKGGNGSGTNVGTASFTGGCGGTFTCGYSASGGGGGAAGYSGNGGNGGSGQTGTNGSSGSGGGGGGGGASGVGRIGGYGGGVGLFGQGTSGSGGSAAFNGVGGGGGSGGAAGSTGGAAGTGGKYGGGAGFKCGGCGSCGGSGAVRIVWPGCKRSFPSTCVGVP